MSEETTKIPQEQTAPSNREYTGPHRRRNDLPDVPALHERGTVRIHALSSAVVMFSCIIVTGLLQTIHSVWQMVKTMTGAEADMDHLLQLLHREQWMIGMLLFFSVLEIVAVAILILNPLSEYIVRIRSHKMLPMKGAGELRYLARAYNLVFEENQRHNEELRYKVEHDALTGLYNRGAYEKLLATHEEQGEIALLWIDVDYFKSFNDKFGHDVGDKVLQKVAYYLSRGFRSTDYACRTGGDEFAVIMTDITPALKEVVYRRAKAVQAGLQDVSDGLPPVTLSIGAAFSAERRPGDQLYKMADKALYRVKEAGRNGVAIFGDEDR